MIAGLPGTGLGGIFYLLAALVVIGREAVRTLRRDSGRTHWRFAARLTLMTIFILLMLWGTYWVLETWLTAPVILSGEGISITPDGAPHTLALPAIFVATLPVQLATIGMLLFSVEVVRWFNKRRAPRKLIPPKRPADSQAH